MFSATFNPVTRVGLPQLEHWKMVVFKLIDEHFYLKNDCFGYRNIFQNGGNALSKMILKTRVFVKKLNISCSLDQTILFKSSLACGTNI